MKNELVSSKQALEDNLGEAVDCFAYPYAFPEDNTSFVQMLRDILVSAGYHQGVSTRIGTARPQEDCYFLRRLPMNAMDDVPCSMRNCGVDTIGCTGCNMRQNSSERRLSRRA